MTLGLLQMVAVAEVENTILIAECNKDQNTCVPNVVFHMIFGLLPTAIAVVVENMKCCNIQQRGNNMLEKIKQAMAERKHQKEMERVEKERLEKQKEKDVAEESARKEKARLEQLEKEKAEAEKARQDHIDYLKSLDQKSLLVELVMTMKDFMYEYNERISNYLEEISDLKSDINYLESKIDDLENEVSSLSSSQR